MSTGSIKDKHQRIIVFLLFIILVLGSLVIGTLNKISTMEKPESVEEPTIEVVEIEKVEPVGKIAIIIDDFGYRNDAVSDGFLELDAELTYAVIPGHEYSRFMSKRASKLGYEVIVHMPMESNEPGFGEEEYVIEEAMPSTEIERRMIKVLDHLPEAVGMNNHQGSKASASERVMNVMGLVLKDNNKYFLDSRTTVETKAEITMRTLGVLTGRRHVFLDNDPAEDLIQEQVKVLAAKAKENGVAVGIGHVKENTLNVLKNAIPDLKEQNFEFVFISEIVE